MYVLVAILFLGNNYHIDPAPILFPNYEVCSAAKEVLYNQLMATRPTPEAQVLTFCTQVPMGV
jgi:hypothetical protein